MNPICQKDGCYMFGPDTDERKACEANCRLSQGHPRTQWPDGTIRVCLSPSTVFCLDLQHTTPDGKLCLSHFDDVSPGDVVTCDDDRNPGCGNQFQLGSTIHLVPLPFEGVVPSCTKLAAMTGDVSYMTLPRRSLDPVERNHDFEVVYKWSNQYKTYGKIPTSAACQWKGTIACYENCGTHLSIDSRDFVYQVMCPACEDVYYCINDIPVSEVR